MIKSEFIIRELKKPFINRIIFAIIFASFFTFILYLIFARFDFTNGDVIKISIYLFWLFGILLLMVVPLITRHYVHFNFSELKIKHSYEIGIFNYNEKWQNLEKLEYISVFQTVNGFEVRLWYKKNKIINLFILDDFNEVLEKAYFFADKLNIDLLDARKRGYHKWINKKVYKESGKIEYLE